MKHDVRELRAGDYAEVLALWQRCERIGLNDADGEAGVVAYLARNPGMSAVSRDSLGRVTGAVLCGHDGRRGYLHHLAVAPEARRKGIAAELLAHSFARLAAAGIEKCNIFLFADNAEGEAFWLNDGWSPRRELVVLQKPVAPRG